MTDTEGPNRPDTANRPKGPEGFAWHASKNGTADITQDGMAAATLRTAAWSDLLCRMEKSETEAQQHLMTRLTGTCRLGRERQAQAQPRDGR